MKYTLATALAATGVNAIHSVSVLSASPYTCNAVSGVDVFFAADEQRITASFPPIALSVIPPAHGYPGGDSDVGCGATVQFEDFPTAVRFRVADVTWRTGRLDLARDNTLDSLRARVDLIVVHQPNPEPVINPVVKNYASANLLDIEVNPALSDYQGVYEHTEKNPDTSWSICFGGYPNNITKLAFDLGGASSGGGTSEPGWSMDLGLVWESCYAPNETVWGQRVIRGWESCTYRQTNATMKRSTNLYPMLE